jgi:Glycosyltransferase family 87
LLAHGDKFASVAQGGAVAMHEAESDSRPDKTARWTWLGEIRERDVAAVLLVGLALWFYLDVGPRGRISPDKPELHRTDFTVYTEAGAAFFDGRDPYSVKNPRGWFYLYPPLFALMVAPLSLVGSVSQVMAWYVVSVALGFGCFGEARRLWRSWTAMGTRHDAPWIAACAGLAVLLPSLECLQRGQLGVALLYALLLGYRLVAFGGWRGQLLGGVVLAWAATVKLIPALPVCFLIGQGWSLALLSGRRRDDLRRASILSAGVVAGVTLFLLVIPAAVLGWGANVRHLETWARKVVTNVDPGQESKFHTDSATNQSFASAAHSLVLSLTPETPNDLRSIARRWGKTADERRFGVDRAAAQMRRDDRSTQRLVKVGQGVFLLLLLGLMLLPWRGDPTGRAVGFATACLGMLLVSPVAWTHYYMMILPAALVVPLWLAQRGHPAASRVMAIAPALLVWAHYLAKRSVGPIGLLGLGTAAWYVAIVIAVARVRWIEYRRSAPRKGRIPTVPSGWKVDEAHDAARAIAGPGERSRV